MQIEIYTGGVFLATMACSASVDDSAILNCSLLHHVISMPMQLMMHLVPENKELVLFDPFAKSESAHASNLRFLLIFA